MPRMNDDQFSQADNMVKELHKFLDKNGTEGDEFSEVWGAVENYVSEQRRDHGKPVKGKRK